MSKPSIEKSGVSKIEKKSTNVKTEGANHADLLS
jgi:hypothetical protein